MNHDSPSTPPSSDPALEARLVAWIAGEASAFEIAELERLVAADPALAALKLRLESVHRLVTAAARPDPTSLRLAAERREKLLRILETTQASTPRAPQLVTFPTPPSRWSWRTPRPYYAISSAVAACFVAFIIYQSQVTPLYRATTTVQFKKADPGLIQMEQVVDASIRFSGSDGTVDQVVRANAEEAQSLRLSIPFLNSAEKKADGLAQSKPGSPSETPPSGAFTRNESVGGAASSTRQSSPPNDLGVARRRAYAAADSSPLPAAIDSPGTGLGDKKREALSLTAPDKAILSRQSFGAADKESALKAGEAVDYKLNSSGIALGKTAQTTLRGDNFSLAPEPVTFRGATGAIFLSDSSKDSGFAANTSVHFGIVAPGSIALGAEASTLSKQKNEIAADAVAGGGLSLPQTDTAKRTDYTTMKFGGSRAPSITATGGSIAAAAPADDFIKLDAFSVASEKDRGYAAASPAPAPILAAPTSPPTDRDELRPAARAKPFVPPTPAETTTAQDPVSTFSLHVSDVSFRLAQAALARGELPDPARIRPEEFYNAFDYGDPASATSEKIGARIEQSAHPFLQQRNLVRLALKVPSTGRGTGTALRLTVLLDTSGSMEREDRAASVRRALEVLVSLLGPDDRLTLIGFARQPRLLAENLPGDRARSILELLARTPSEGGTNLEEALKLGGELARRHRTPNAQNRLVLLTDGAANLGDAEPARLATAITALRQQGIAFDACGVGLHGLDDEILEALTRQGDGRYYALNSPSDADGGFAQKLAGAFRPAAENVKVQVRFNPARVGRYRLIGFEQHRLREEDFRNDQVDAAELAADEAAVALYQVEVLPQGEGELGEIFVRFRDAASGTMVERSWSLAYAPAAPAFDRASPSLQLAGLSALLAEKLRGGAAANEIKLRDLAPIANSLRGHYAPQPRVQDLVAMFAQSRRLLGD